MEGINFVRTQRMRVSAILSGVVLGLLVQYTGVVVCDARERDVLRGIRAIGIEVEQLPRLAERIGIKQDSLKTEVLAKLRLAGVAIAGEEEYKHNPSIPFLKVSLLISYNKPTYVYAVVVGLNEKVHVERDPEIISYSLPWWRIIKGERVGEGDVARDVQDTLQHIMNEFVAEYASSNRTIADPHDVKNVQQDMHPDMGDGQDKRQH